MADQTEQRSGKKFRCIAISLLVLLLIFGVVVLTIWLTTKPKKLVVTVENGKVYGFTIYNNHTNLNANFDFVLKIHNPSARVSLYYRSFKVFVLINNQKIAFERVGSVFQRHQNVTDLHVMPSSQSVLLGKEVSNAIRVQNRPRKIDLGINVEAILRFKVGKWRSSRYSLKVSCSNMKLSVHTTERSFQTSSCKEEIRKGVHV